MKKYDKYIRRGYRNHIADIMREAVDSAKCGRHGMHIIGRAEKKLYVEYDDGSSEPDGHWEDKITHKRLNWMIDDTIEQFLDRTVDENDKLLWVDGNTPLTGFKIKCVGDVLIYSSFRDMMDGETALPEGWGFDTPILAELSISDVIDEVESKKLECKI